jgi:hypothetical protein
MAQETSKYFDVRAGYYGSNFLVKRFAPQIKGEQRAEEYAEAYNESFREALGLLAENVDMRVSHFMSSGDYEQASRAETYRADRAYVIESGGVPVIEDHDPMPTDYPHGH